MKKRYTKEYLTKIVSTSTTWADVCRAVGVRPLTGSQTYVKSVAKEFGIDYSHFTGSAHNRNKSWIEVDVTKYLFNGSRINSDRLKKYLFKAGIKEEKCEYCGITEWLGEKVVFELQHLDGNHFNNELINLKVLCPNCHSLDTRKMRRLKKEINRKLKKEATSQKVAA